MNAAFSFILQLDVIFVNNTINQQTNVTMTTKGWPCSDPELLIGWKDENSKYERCDVMFMFRNGVYTTCDYKCDVIGGHMTQLRVRLPNTNTIAAICEITFDYDI